MKLVLVSPLCFLLMQTLVVSSFLGRELRKRQLDNKLNLEYRINRGVAYISQPSSVPSISQTTSDTRGPSKSNGPNVNYDIFELPDERPGSADGPVRIPPAPSQPADSQLPPKFGPVLFPDEEAAAQNNGSAADGKNNQNTKDPSAAENPPQGQENNRNNGVKNTGRPQQREHSSNRGGNSSNRYGNSKWNSPAYNRQNGNNGNRNGNNGNGNGNGRGSGRKNCSFPVEMIFCILGR